jgi:hypothetical protein
MADVVCANIDAVRKVKRRAWYRVWWRKNRDRLNAAKQERHRLNPEKKRAYDKQYHVIKGRDLKRIRHRAWREQLATRPRPTACEICGTVGRVVFDHCHTSGKFRGWICTSCNRALGYFKDSPNVLLVAVAYLRGSV